MENGYLEYGILAKEASLKFIYFKIFSKESP